MILASFLGARYAQAMPLSLSASLVFEQSYGPIEGDSAWLAELCAYGTAHRVREGPRWPRRLPSP